MAQRLLKAHLRVLVVQLEHVSLYFLCRGKKISFHNRHEEVGFCVIRKKRSTGPKWIRRHLDENNNNNKKILSA